MVMINDYETNVYSYTKLFIRNQKVKKRMPK